MGKERKEVVKHLERIRAEVKALPCPPRIRVISTGKDPATESFVRGQARRAKEVGISFEIQRFSKSVSTKELVEAVSGGDVDALVVHLPLPVSVDTATVLATIPLRKDADVLSPVAYSMFEENVSGSLMPPVVWAVDIVLKTYSVSPTNRRVVVVGGGIVVGKPAATYFKREGATVVDVVTLEAGSLAETLPRADIIVSGAGVPKLITPKFIKNNVVLIDIGTTDVGGVIVGDIDPECSKKASFQTPVPGGIGPLTVVGLLNNVLELTIRSLRENKN